LRHSLYQYKPILFQWIKQYKNRQNRICDVCARATSGTKHFATYQIDVYFDLMQSLHQQSSGMISLERVSQQMWDTLIQEQMENLPQVKRVDHCCEEHTAFQIDTFLGTSDAAERLLIIPRINKGHPLASLLSWVLFKRASNPEQPMAFMTESTKPLKEVVKQGETILRTGTTVSAQHFPG
jgi:hypothetical protein